MITIAQAIKSLESNAEFVIRGDAPIDWITTPISDADIATEVTRLQAEYDSQQYSRDRATDYPAIADQLDDIFHNGIDGWKATIQLTKDKYPKGGN
jgi:hypothetical protein